MVTVKHAWKYVQRIGYNNIIAAMIIDTKSTYLMGPYKNQHLSLSRVTAITSEKLLGFGTNVLSVSLSKHKGENLTTLSNLTGKRILHPLPNLS